LRRLTADYVFALAKTKAGNLAFHEEILKLSKETIALGNDLIRELA
jgi:hypothetical protein